MDIRISNTWSGFKPGTSQIKIKIISAVLTYSVPKNTDWTATTQSQYLHSTVSWTADSCQGGQIIPCIMEFHNHVNRIYIGVLGYDDV
jgi:hypothetical protein